MSKTISKHIGEGFGKGELYAALAYDATDQFGGMKIKSLMLNSTEKLFFRDSGLYLNSSADGTLDVVGDTILNLSAPTTNVDGATLFKVTPDTLVSGNLACSSRLFQKNTTTSNTSGATVTYTAAEIVGGYIIDAASEACAATTATGTELVAAVPNCVDGSSFLFILKNDAAGAYTITLGGGTDVTITGTATVAQNNTKVFLVVITSVSSHTATFYSIGTMVH